jgi:6-phosphogluconate dehydrogenase
MHYEESLRHVICASTEIGIPAPAFMASLGYIDSYRSAWLPANLIQAQRDFFGSHMYERIDEQGTFHTSWEKEKS